MITFQQAARLIDISAVRTHHNSDDIKQLVAYAEQYRFINVHVLPSWVKLLSDMLKDMPDVYVGAPVGFPSGGHKTSIKLAEAKELVADGVQEMDIVMNVGMFRKKEYNYVLDELKLIIEQAPSHVLTKVLIEINTLDDDEMIKACRLAIESGADFVKTGTGWVPGGANVERIRAMKAVCGGKIKIKAAGGIRTTEEFLELVDMGIERFGINTKSAIEIVEQIKSQQ